MNREYLDKIYQELIEATAKVKALEGVTTFQAESCDIDRHSVALQAAQDHRDCIDKLIDDYLRLHGA